MESSPDRDNGEWRSEKAEPPPPASDSRVAQPGAPYIPSGELGSWWFASIGAIVIGLCAGCGSGLLAAWLVVSTTRTSALLKGVSIALVVGVVVASLATAFLSRLAKVRSLSFVGWLGLGAGIAFGYGGTCGAIQCFLTPPPPDWSTAISGWWDNILDGTVLLNTLQAALPAVWQVVVLLAVAVFSAVLICVGSGIACTYLTHGFLFEEATGGWFRKPVLIARTCAAQPNWLFAIDPSIFGKHGIIDSDLSKPAPDGFDEWVDVYLHPSISPHELSLVRFRSAKVEIKQTFLMKKRRVADYDGIGDAYFMRTADVERVREQARTAGKLRLADSDGPSR
jgi:hypothetical protein